MGIVGINTVPTIEIGGRTMLDDGNLKCLTADLGSTTTTMSLWSTAREPGAAAGYQVPAGKSFRILAYEIQGSSEGTAQVNYFGGYNDSDLGFRTSVVFGDFAADNGKDFFGGGAPIALGTLVVSSEGTHDIAKCKIQSACDFLVPAGKYITGGCATGGGHVKFWGRLE